MLPTNRLRALVLDPAAGPPPQDVPAPSSSRIQGLGKLACLPDELLKNNILPHLSGEQGCLHRFSQASSLAAEYAIEAAHHVQNEAFRRRTCVRTDGAKPSSLLRGARAPHTAPVCRYTPPIYTAAQEQEAGRFLDGIAYAASIQDASFCLQKKYWSKSHEAIDRALEIKPNGYLAHVGRGRLLFEEKRYAEAEVSYRRAIALKSDLRGVHYALGETLRHQQRYADAEASYRTASKYCCATLRARHGAVDAGAVCRRRGQFSPDGCPAAKRCQRTSSIGVGPAPSRARCASGGKLAEGHRTTAKQCGNAC